METKKLGNTALQVMASPSGAELRKEKGLDELLKSTMLDEIKNIKEAHNKLILMAASYAQMQADLFSDFGQKLYEMKPRQYTKYTTRVRYLEKTKTLSMVWEKVCHNKKRQRFAVHMPMGYNQVSSKKYNIKQFTKVSDEELTHIRHIEDKYALIREAIETMKKMRINISEYERRVIKMFDLTNFD